MDIDVLVAGAGPTGLAMAAQLARRGVRHMVVDTTHERDGACLITAHAMEHLDRLGVAAPLATERTDELAGIVVPFDQDDTRYPGVYVVPRRALMAALGPPPARTLVAIEPDAGGLRARLDLGHVRCRYAVVCEPACEPGDVPTTADLRVALLTGHKLARRPRYRSGRVFYAGELGPSDGILDTANLAWKLDSVLRGGPAALLDTYAEERRPAEVRRWLFRMVPVATRPLARSRIAVDLLARFVCELDLAYGRSQFVREGLAGADDTFLTGIAPGERVPDVCGLHAMLRGPGPHVLALGDVADLRSIDHRVRYTPATAPLFRDFGVTGAATFVVLPDLHLGFRCFGPRVDELARYLAEIAPPPPELHALTRRRSVAP